MPYAHLHAYCNSLFLVQHMLSNALFQMCCWYTFWVLSRRAQHHWHCNLHSQLRNTYIYIYANVAAHTFMPRANGAISSECQYIYAMRWWCNNHNQQCTTAQRIERILPKLHCEEYHHQCGDGGGDGEHCHVKDGKGQHVVFRYILRPRTALGCN